MRAAVLWLGVLGACGGERSTSAVPDAAPAAGCARRLELGGGAFACAFMPSATAAGISDAFGWHVVAFPAAPVTAATPVYVHFVGTNGMPATASGIFTNLPILRDGTGAGFLVINLAYSDTASLNLLCRNELDCYEPVRWEIVTGEDAAPPWSDRKQVVVPDDSDHRLAALVDALAASGLVEALPAALRPVDWSRLRVGGHSQGGGQAGVIARRRAVERVCMFAAPVDSSATWSSATWVGSTWATPLARRRVVVHENDPFYASIAANATTMGMMSDVHLRVLHETSADPHGYPVASDDAIAHDARAWACFE